MRDLGAEEAVASEPLRIQVIWPSSQSCKAHTALRWCLLGQPRLSVPLPPSPSCLRPDSPSRCVQGHGIHRILASTLMAQQPRKARRLQRKREAPEGCAGTRWRVSTHGGPYSSTASALPTAAEFSADTLDVWPPCRRLPCPPVKPSLASQVLTEVSLRVQAALAEADDGVLVSDPKDVLLPIMQQELRKQAMLVAPPPPHLLPARRSETRCAKR